MKKFKAPRKGAFFILWLKIYNMNKNNIFKKWKKVVRDKNYMIRIWRKDGSIQCANEAKEQIKIIKEFLQDLRM